MATADRGVGHVEGVEAEVADARCRRSRRRSRGAAGRSGCRSRRRAAARARSTGTGSAPARRVVADDQRRRRRATRARTSERAVPEQAEQRAGVLAEGRAGRSRRGPARPRPASRLATRARPSSAGRATKTAPASAEEHEPVRARSAARSRASATSARGDLAVTSTPCRRPIADAARSAMRPAPPASSTVARGGVGRRRRRVGEVGERVRGDRRPGAAATAAGRPSTHRSIRSSSSRPASRRRSWTARCELAGVALGAQLRASARVSRTTTSPSCVRDRRAGRGVAWISTSSARQRHPAERDRAVGWNSPRLRAPRP